MWYKYPPVHLLYEEAWAVHHMLQNSAQKEMYAKVGTVNNVM